MTQPVVKKHINKKAMHIPLKSADAPLVKPILTGFSVFMPQSYFGSNDSNHIADNASIIFEQPPPRK